MSPLLGVHEGRGIYLLYNGILKDKSIGGGNVLTGPVFEVLPKFSGSKVIYAAANRMGGRAARRKCPSRRRRLPSWYPRRNGIVLLSACLGG